MSTETLKLWEHVFGDERGLLALWTAEREGGGLKDERTRYFNYPREAQSATDFAVGESEEGREAYFCVHLLTNRRRVKENASAVASLWGESDGGENLSNGFRPTALVESSPGHFHIYYRLTDAIPPEIAEGLNRRIASKIGADPSGFDLTQLLRVPGTANYKYPERPVVRLLHIDQDRAFSPAELDDELPVMQVKREPEKEGDQGSSEGPPVVLEPGFLHVWDGTEPKLKEDGQVDRSGSLMRIGRVLYDAGANRHVIENALEERDRTLGWNKYTERDDSGLRYSEIVDELESSGRNTKVTVGRGKARDLDSPERVWPELDEAALYGLAGDIVKTLGPHTEADPVAVLMNTLTAFGNASGRGAFARVGTTEHHLKMFVGLVGETAKGRKGESWTPVNKLMEAVDPGWSQNRVMSGLSSGEGLIYAVRDEVRGERKGEEVVLDPGEPDKRLLAVEGELAGLLKVMSREGNTLSPTIRQAWDGDRLRTMTKNNPTKATGAHISVIGHVTKAELLRHLSDTEAANGFANRFLWIMVRRSKLLPFGGSLPHEELASLTKRLDSAVRFAREIRPVAWGESAREAWQEVYGPLSEGKPGLFGSVVGRAEAQTLRMATLYSVMDESKTIEFDHLAAALALWNYAEESARYIFGDATGDPVADDTLEALRAAGEGGLSRTDIRDLFGRHKSADRISSALGILLKLGRVRKEEVATGGRPTERWYAE